VRELPSGASAAAGLAMPFGRMPRGALSLTGGAVYSDEAHKKPGQAATQSVDLAAITAAKLASGAAAAWHPDGIVAAESQDDPGIISLLVVEKERVSAGQVVVDGTAYVAPPAAIEGSAVAGSLASLYASLKPTCLLQHCGGSDCAITVSAAAPSGMDVPPGCVALDAVQRMNLHVAHNTLYQFELLPAEPPPLVDIQVEAALLPRSMKLWEQISDLHAGVTPCVTSLPSSEPEPEPTAEYMRRHGLAGVSDRALVALAASSAATQADTAAPYRALAEWFQQQADLAAVSSTATGSGSSSEAAAAAAAAEDEEQEVGGTVSASALRAALSKGYFHRCLSMAEKVVVVVDGMAVLLRVQLVNDKTAEEQALEAVYHCHRGLLTDETEIYVVAERRGDGVGLRTVVALQVDGAAPRPPFLSSQGSNAGDDADACNADGVPYSELPPEAQPLHPSEIRVHTNDDEWFPVKRGLLKCCISLTQALRDKRATSVSVDLDCLVFDRVLLFLEAEALGRSEKYDFDINHVEEMTSAAETLGCQPLTDRCAQKTGAFFARIKEYRYEEVVAANASGERLIIIDGMVLDVKRWLPEHPGGSKIIPKQVRINR
jgi:cytochrome b involved in lipid metabolism